jgi:hypothetical protein
MRISRITGSFLAFALAGCQAKTASDTSSPRASAATPPGVEAARSRPLPPPPVVLPEGTVLPVRLQSSLSSATSRAGETVVGELADDVSANGRVVLKQGTEVRGRVTRAVPSGRVKGRARLAFVFDRVVVNGRERDVDARAIDITAASAKKRDAAIIGGGAAGGAIIGAVADGKKGAAIGGLIGGAAGTGAVLATKGKEVELPAGTPVRVKIERPIEL